MQSEGLLREAGAGVQGVSLDESAMVAHTRQGGDVTQGGHLPKIPGGTAITYKVENAIKSPKKP